MKNNKKMKKANNDEWVDLYASMDTYIKQGESESIPLKIKEHNKVEIDFNNIEFEDVEGLKFSIDDTGAFSYVSADCILGNTVFSGIYVGSVIKQGTKIGKCKLLKVIEEKQEQEIVEAKEDDIVEVEENVVDLVASISKKKKK